MPRGHTALSRASAADRRTDRLGQASPGMAWAQSPGSEEARRPTGSRSGATVLLRPRVKEDVPGLAPSVPTREVRRGELVTLRRLWRYLH